MACQWYRFTDGQIRIPCKRMRFHFFDHDADREEMIDVHIRDGADELDPLTGKILGKDELKEIKSNHVHQLIQKGKITPDNLLEAVALLMVKKKSDTLNQIKVVPVTVAGKPVAPAIEDNGDNGLALKALIGDRCEFVQARDGAEGIAQAR